jgi:hypothetical protein
MTVQNLIEYDPPKMLSMREVRVAGATANRLTSLRGTLSSPIKGGSFVVSNLSGTVSFALCDNDVMAILGLLTERDELFLMGLNVEITE